jgi:RNA polymerase sigma-70 factor, ECF subfamily
MDEQQAILRLKRGDIGGLEFLVQRYQVKSIRAAYLITRDLALAEDVVQDSFIQAFHAIRGFDASRPFEPWFLRSVVNAAVKVVQKAARQVPMPDDAHETIFAELAAQSESVEAQADSAEVQRQIWEAMQKLSARQRAVVVQRYFLGMSEAEMARESGTATGTIKWLLNAARERMRTMLPGRHEK